MPTKNKDCWTSYQKNRQKRKENNVLIFFKATVLYSSWFFSAYGVMFSISGLGLESVPIDCWPVIYSVTQRPYSVTLSLSLLSFTVFWFTIKIKKREWPTFLNHTDVQWLSRNLRAEEFSTHTHSWHIITTQ